MMADPNELRGIADGMIDQGFGIDELRAENDRLREEIIAARNFLTIGNPVNADRHLRAALNSGKDE